MVDREKVAEIVKAIMLHGWVLGTDKSAVPGDVAVSPHVDAYVARLALLAPTPAAVALDEAAIKRATMDHNRLTCPGIGEIDRLVMARGRELAEALAATRGGEEPTLHQVEFEDEGREGRRDDDDD